MLLDGRTMHVSSTASNGVVGSDTILRFRQLGNRVIATYAGGRVPRGLLVGRLSGHTLVFRYAQRELDGAIHGGASECDVQWLGGRVRIVERFRWSTRAGSGVNVFDEVDARPD